VGKADLMFGRIVGNSEHTSQASPAKTHRTLGSCNAPNGRACSNARLARPRRSRRRSAGRSEDPRASGRREWRPNGRHRLAAQPGTLTTWL
jgi:hypothetical protein